MALAFDVGFVKNTTISPAICYECIVCRYVSWIVEILVLSFGMNFECNGFSENG